MEIFLTQLFGLYFLVMGGLVLFRQNSIMPAVKDLVANRGLVLAIAIIELVAGIALVLAYPEVSLSIVGLFSLIGWMMIVESILYVVLSSKGAQQFTAKFNKREFYIGGGIVFALVGLYLVGVGFGFVV